MADKIVAIKPDWTKFGYVHVIAMKGIRCGFCLRGITRDSEFVLRVYHSQRKETITEAAAICLECFAEMREDSGGAGRWGGVRV
jgi:hypothetical protein